MSASSGEARSQPRRRRPRWRVLLTVVIAFHLLGFLSSLDALMSTRTSQGAVAWIVSLNTVPYVAVPAYWVFGASEFRGYVVARRDEDSSLARALQPKTEELWSHQYVAQEPSKHLDGVQQLARWPFLHGNEVELLVDGEATFDSIFRGIE